MAESIPRARSASSSTSAVRLPRLGEALAQWVRYLNLLDDAVEVALVGGALRVVVESEAPAPASHELCFAWCCVRHAPPRGVRSKVEAVRSPIGAGLVAARYRDFFGAACSSARATPSWCFARDAARAAAADRRREPARDFWCPPPNRSAALARRNRR